MTDKKTPPALWKHHRRILLPRGRPDRLIFLLQCRRLANDLRLPLKKVIRRALEKLTGDER